MKIQYIVEEIWGVVENGCRRAEALMNAELYDEARFEVLTSIVVALIRTRIYCSNSVISTTACSYLESSLNHAIKMCYLQRVSEAVDFLDAEFRKVLSIHRGLEVDVEKVLAEV